MSAETVTQIDFTSVMVSPSTVATGAQVFIATGVVESTVVMDPTDVAICGITMLGEDQ